MAKKAEYQISTSVNEGIFEIILTGKATKDNVEKLAIETAVVVMEDGAKNILVDVRALEGRLGVLDTYSIVRNPYEKPKVNCAVVDLPENLECIMFLETTSLNAGLLLKCFIDIDAARAWLKSKKKKS
jgi:hypothetical protein